MVSSVRKAQAYPVCLFIALLDGTSSVTTRPGGKLRLYHRDMLGEDVSGRFDYLFEPLEVNESAGNGDNVAPRTITEPENGNRWSNRIVLAGIVVATLAAATVTAIVLMQPVQPAQQSVIPRDSAPPSTTAPAATSPPMPSTTAPPVPVLPATAGTSAARPPAAPPIVAPQPSPFPQPTTVASEPPATMPPPPTTRAPISVSPETRAPFPNQPPPRKNGEGGGLLGGLL
jgi:hypothetical protein